MSVTTQQPHPARFGKVDDFLPRNRVDLEGDCRIGSRRKMPPDGIGQAPLLDFCAIVHHERNSGGLAARLCEPAYFFLDDVEFDHVCAGLGRCLDCQGALGRFAGRQHWQQRAAIIVLHKSASVITPMIAERERASPWRGRNIADKCRNLLTSAGTHGVRRVRQADARPAMVGRQGRCWRQAIRGQLKVDVPPPPDHTGELTNISSGERRLKVLQRDVAADEVGNAVAQEGEIGVPVEEEHKVWPGAMQVPGNADHRLRNVDFGHPVEVEGERLR